jgi:hypothetical protein
MHQSDGDARQRSTLPAALGAIAFSVLTLAAVMASNAPGGGYSTSQVADYLASGNRVRVIVVFHLALIGVLGLVSALAHVRETVANRRTASIIWGTGLAAAACFAIGWGVDGGQVIAHLEGGSDVAIAPAVTYLISEVGVVFVFGAGAILLGLALIVLSMSSGTPLPNWLRRVTLVCGIAGVAGLAFFPFFILILWGLAVGVWLSVDARHVHSPSATAGSTA